MKSQILDRQPMTYAVIFETGDEVTKGLASFAQEHRLKASHFTAIGGFQDVTLGYFDWHKKEYRRIPVHQQVEVLSLTGDVALDNGKPAVHAHVIIGKPDGSAHGGHLLEAHVRPTLEVMLVESAGEMHKSYDPLSRLDLISA